MAATVLELTADDEQLLEGARRKDRDAIRLIIKQHNQRLYRIARSIVRNNSDAEDVLQEAYVRAFTSLSQFRGEARLSTWLARIVINEALGLIRRRRPAIDIALVSTNPALDAEIIRFPGANRVPDPEMTMAQTEIRMLLERAIDKLPPTFREVLIARLVEGMSVAETAEVVWNPVSNRQNQAVPRPRAHADGNGAAYWADTRQRLPLRRRALRTSDRRDAEAARALTFPGTF